jgi:ABC-type uncharacterized transport system permease subunit
VFWAELAFYTAVAAYAGACALFHTHLANHPGVSRAGGLAVGALFVAAIFHAAHVVTTSVVTHVCPIRSVHFVVSFGALLGSLIYLVLRRQAAVRPLGAFIAPAALTALLASRFMASPDHKVSGSFLALHVAVNMIGDAMFLLASAAAALYLIEERRLKRRHPATLFGRLPALDALDRAQHRFLLGGFPLLTLGIITGTVWAHRLLAGSPSEIARALLAYATWTLFASVLVLRSALGWRGRKAALGTLAGFAFAVAVLVVYLVRNQPGAPS